MERNSKRIRIANNKLIFRRVDREDLDNIYNKPVLVNYHALTDVASCFIATPCLLTNPKEGRGGIG